MARIYLLLALLVFSISCSRSVDTEATLSFQFKNVNKGPQSSSILPGYYPSKLFVSIKYDNKTHTQEWECPYERNSIAGYDLTDCDLPSSMAMNKTIPSGGNRLVQVLVVYFNDREQMQFFYSDKVVSFTGGTANVVVGDAGWTMNTSGKEGSVAGRLTRGYSYASDLYGTAIGYYEPANGRPEMAVVKESVFAGWFDFMFLEDVRFTYKMQDTNEVLIANKRLQDFDKLNTEISARGFKMLKVHVPAHYEVYQKGNKDLKLVDIEDADPSSTFDISGASSLAEALFDNSDLSYIKATSGPIEYTLDFNRFINILEIGFEYNDSPTSVAIAPSGEDNMSVAVEYTPIMTSVTPGATASSQTYNTPLNATRTLNIEIPNNVTKYEKMLIRYQVYDSSYVAQRDNYLLYYNISANDIYDNSVSAGNVIGYPATPSGTPYPLKQGQLIATETDPVDENGTWLLKANQLSGFSNSVFVEGNNMFDGSNSKRMYVAKKYSITCNVPAEDCIFLDYYSLDTYTAAPFYGPYNGSKYFSCPSAECNYSFNYQHGVTGLRSIMFKVPNNTVHDKDIDCAALEASNVTLEDLGTSLSMTSVSSSSMLTSDLVLCPYKLESDNTKKYFNFGRVLYKSM